MPIRVELELDNGNFTSRMIHAGETVQQFRNNVNGAIVGVQRLSDRSTTLLGTMRDLAITLGMARIAFEGLRSVSDGWAGDIIRINADMERLTFLLAGMSKAAEPMKEAQQQVKFLRDFAKEAPFSLQALSDTFVKMRATGIEPMGGALKALTDGIAAFGGNDETLKRATIALQQMSGKGVIQMEELRQQLGEAIPRAVELMARSMGLTTGQLIAQVGKGTLEAKTSLQAFHMEMDRTFGGAAQEQMNTFNGMISKAKTLMQNLALDIGESGFFDAVKQQLRAFNQALEGDTFANASKSVGQFLGKVVNGLGSAIQTVIQFRDEIIKTGEALAIAFGASMAAKSLQAFSGMIMGMREGLALISLQASQTFRSMAGTGGLLASVRSVGDAMLALQLTTQSFGVALTRLLPLLGVTVAFFAEWALPIVALGAVVYGLWQAFGAGKDVLKEAYEGLEKVGAQTQKQIDDAKRYADTIREQIKAQEELAQVQAKYGLVAQGPTGSDPTEQVDILKKKLAKAESTIAASQEDLNKRNADKFLQTLRDDLEKTQARRKLVYDKEASAASTAYAEQVKQLQEANKSIAAVQEKHQNDQRAKNLAYYNLQVEDAKAQLDAVETLAKNGDDRANRVLEKRTQELVGFIADRKKQIEILTVAPKGPVEVDKPINVNQLLERARTKLDSVKSDLAGQKAQLEGINGEYAKMVYLIENAVAKSNGQWTMNDPAIQAVINQLKETQLEIDKTKEKLDALTAFNRDLSSAEMQARAEYIKQLTHGKEGLDALAAKKLAGMYDGKSPIERMMSGVKVSAEEAGKAMNDAFGAGVQDKGSTLTSIVERLGGAWKAVRDNAAGVANESMSMDSTYRPGSTFAQNLIQRESGGRADATNSDSSAVGLGQFLKSTWKEFLRDRHPDILARGEKEALATRTDARLSQEAIDWYAAQNANKLERAGIRPDDANTYLAHFLGPGGAIAALTQSSNTLLSSIKGLDAARAANPQVFRDNKTVGDLQNWARSFMGQGTTFSRAGSSTASLGVLMDGANESQKASLLRTQHFADEAKRLLGDNNLADQAKDMALAIQKAAEQEDGLNKHLAETQKLIREGKFGMDHDPDSDRYKNLIKLAKDWDKADEEAHLKRRSRQRTNTILERLPGERETLDARQEEADRRLRDATRFRLTPGFYSLQRITNRDIDLLSRNSEDQPQNAERNSKAIAEKQAMLEQARNLEIENAIITEQEKMRVMERSLMTARQARDAEFDLEVQRQENYLALYTGNAEQRKLIEEQVTRNIALLRRKQFDLTPIGGMLRQWRDFNQNIEQAATGWMNSFNDKLADMVVKGKLDFASLRDQILKDIVTMSLKAAQSQLFSGLFGGLFGGGGSSPLNILSPIHHTGGIAGDPMPYRSVNPMMFAGAQRWHTGTNGLTLGGDEIPIIAKRGEQVDWPENLAKQYGGGGGNVISPTIAVTVQGSPGMSNTDHQKMGENIGRAAMEHVREMMAKEMYEQRRPGGLLQKARR